MEPAQVTYTFFGKVFPERALVNVSRLQFSLRNPDAGIEGDLKLWIDLSQITVVFAAPHPVNDVPTLRNQVEDAIRLAVDALGYVLGCGYDVEITQMIDSQGSQPVIFGVGIPVLLARTRKVELQDLLPLFGDHKGDYLRRALADLREAIRSPKDTAFFCFRALESIRQFFFHERGCKDKKESWDKLKADLQIDIHGLDFLTEPAQAIRHGEGRYQSDEQRAKTFSVAWDVVERFVLYAKNGYAPVT